MSEADPCRRALTPVEEARLFSADAVRAARDVMAGKPLDAASSAYLAVFAILAAAALDPASPGKGYALSAYPATLPTTATF